MNKTIVLIALALILSVNTTFSKDKIYLPIEERLRPLSIPRKTWKIDLGMEYAFGQSDGSSECAYINDLYDFQFPYLTIGERIEIDFVLPSVNFYPVKNTIVEDNSLTIDGTNFLIYGGMHKIAPQRDDGDITKLSLECVLGCQMKMLAGKRAWIFFNGNGLIDLEKKVSGSMSLGYGFQITKYFSISTAFSGSANDYSIFSNSERDDGFFIIHTPVDFKFNTKRNRGILFRTGYACFIDNEYKMFFWGIPVGIQYSWHW